MIALSFLLGVMITISEPDLQVLAGQVPSIPNMVLILTVAVGVGFFLVLALVRMLFGIQLSHMLLVFYAVVFTLFREISLRWRSIRAVLPQGQ